MRPDSRRQTLSALSTNRQHDRGRGRHSLAARPSHGVGAASSRRSSVYGKGQVFQDPRQIRQREFKEKSTELLIEFLSAHHFESVLSPKILTCPSTKLFHEIVKFLIHEIDPTFEIDRFEESVSLFFDKLGYPFKLSKGSIKSASTPHKWPDMLAAVVWLVEVLMYNESCSQQPADDEPIEGQEETKAKEETLERLSLVYQSWLSARLDDADCDDQLTALWSSSCEGTQEEIDNFRVANERLLAIIAEEKKFPTLEDIHGKHDVRAQDVSNFKRLNAKSETHARLKQTEVETRGNVLKSKKSEVVALRDRVMELENTLKNQKLTPQDVKDINQRRVALEGDIDELQYQKEAIRKEIELTDNRIRKLVPEIEERGVRVNGHLEALRLLPRQEMHKRCPVKAIQFSTALRSPDLGTDFQGLSFCVQDLPQVLGKLRAYGGKLDVQVDKKQLAVREARAQFESRQGEIEGMKQQIEGLNERGVYVDAENQKARTELWQIEHDSKGKVEKIELAMLEIENGDFENEEKALEQQLDQIRAKREECERECDARRVRVKEALFEVMQKAAKYRIFVRSKLNDMNELMDGMLEETQFAIIEIAECSSEVGEDNLTAMSD